MRTAGSWMAALLLSFVFAGDAVLEIFSVEETLQGYRYHVGDIAVEPEVFCDALNKPGKDLAVKMKIMRIHCADLNFQSFYRSNGRKLLGYSQDEISSEPLQKIALAVSGMFLLCCAFICPCFRSRFKDIDEQPVLGRGANSGNHSSSYDPNSRSRNSGRTPHHHRSAPGTPRFYLSRESSANSVRVDLNQIVKATKHFSDSHKIGEGDFGTVYKAVLHGGQVVAVKRARRERFQDHVKEFTNEVDLLTKIDHRCLVKIIDYIDEGNERIIISEYVSNGNLREHLDGHRGKILSFGQRLEIAIDVAHGLTYLHSYAEKMIIHRDVKSSNILLTDDLKAKVADFGFAKASSTEEENTHISTNVRGTLGYLDPEYAATYQLSPKSDVFSYGVLLAEIVSGRRPVDSTRPQHDRVTIKWAFNKFKEGRQKEILDPLITEEVDGEVLTRILALAFRCARNTRSERPSMREVVSELWSIRRAFNPQGFSVSSP